jgi:hypothetical protein
LHVSTPGVLSVTGSDCGSGGTTYTGTFPIAVSGSVISFGGLSTSTPAVIGNIPYFSGVNTFANVATSTLIASSPLTGSFTHVGTTGSLGCQTATGSQAGCLSSADWTTFNSKLSNAITSFNGLTGASQTLATTSSNGGWGFSSVGTTHTLNIPTASATNPLGLLSSSDWSTFSGKLSAAITALGPAGQTQTGATQTLATSTSAFNGLTPNLIITGSGNTQTFTSSLSGTLAVGGGGTGQTTFTSGFLLYGAGSGAVQAIATSTVALSASFSGSIVSLGIGGTNSLSIANAGVTNAMLANSSISGVSLGGSLFALTHDSTLTGTSFNGSAAVSNWGLDLTHANTWTGLQTFNGNASSTQMTSTGSSYLATASGGVEIGTTTANTKLLYVSGDVASGVATLERVNASTNQAVGTVIIKGYSTGTMTDGFGSAFQFGIQGLGTSENLIANIQGVRDGADNSGALRFTTENAGVLTAIEYIKANGRIGVATDTPFSTFSINAAAGTPAFAVGSSTNSLLWIDSLGKTWMRDILNGWNGIQTPTRYITMFSATTTTLTGTSSAPYDPAVTLPFTGSIQTAQCLASTTNAFIGVQPYIGTTALTFFVASNTVGTMRFTSNNTFSAGQVISFAIGTGTAATANQNVNCTFAAIQTQ